MDLSDNTIRAVSSTADGIATITRVRPVGTGARVRVTSAGICGSDLHSLASGPSAVVPGHEFGGLLDDGRLVAVRPYRACGTCALCVRGDAHLCANVPREFYGATLDGGFADEVLVAPECIVSVPDGVQPDTVALVEPIAVAIHAVNRAAPAPGERVLVVGGGAVGLLCASVLVDRGVAVDLAARHSAQREAARDIGAGEPDQGPYDVVIDAAGTSSSCGQAVNVAARGGRIVMVALPWEPIGLPVAFVLKEISVIPAVFYGHHAGLDEFRSAAELLARHPELPSVLVTHRFTLDEADEAFRAAADRAAGAIKVHVIP